MEKRKAVFKRGQVRAIPRKLKIIWILLSVLCVLALLSTLKSPTTRTKNLQQVELNIDEITCWDTRTLTESRYKIVMRSHGERYYLWCPYSNFEPIREHLLSGEISTVIVSYVRSNPVVTAIYGKRIVDCRSDDMIFYKIEDELRLAKHDWFGAWVLLCISLVLWLAYTAWVVTVYAVYSRNIKHH